MEYFFIILGNCIRLHPYNRPAVRGSVETYKRQKWHFGYFGQGSIFTVKEKCYPYQSLLRDHKKDRNVQNVVSVLHMFRCYLLRQGPVFIYIYDCIIWNCRYLMFHSFLIFVRSKNLEFFKNGIYNLVLDLVLAENY